MFDNCSIYAHSRFGRPPSEWEPLIQHLQVVAGRAQSGGGAAGFADVFGAREWGRLAGLWHDLGKYSDEFQAYLLQANGHEAHIEAAGKVDHSTAGAQHAVARLGPEIGGILAYCIAGHHGGLPDHTNESGLSDLNGRLQKRVPIFAAAPREVLEQVAPPQPRLAQTDRNHAGFTLATFTRMLFSCLVDADYLATEAWMDEGRATVRQQRGRSSISALRAILDHYLESRFGDPPAGTVNVERAAVLGACRAAASLPPGLFSLTVPTGGGKTLSSLAFALQHASEHHLRRVIYAIPFTSIVEQTADVFRTALAGGGDDAVLEHHSSIDPESERFASRLAAENWDAPIIVTTNVQLFESLFANRPSRCRKLHRIARSVIILDEAQTLPVTFLAPTLAMLDELRRNYGCTIVLCTATQPAITRRQDFKIGLTDVHEIIPAPTRLYQALRRVEVQQVGTLGDEELTRRLTATPQALCIVNTRAHAAELFSRLRPEQGGERDGVFHLSTRLCAAHRSDLLSAIKQRLAAQQPCLVVSTQLIEAGVDIDFPVVYRAMAGLDSIAQAAGRCNREGRLQTRGQVFVFETEALPPGMFRPAIQCAGEVAACQDDLLSHEAIEQYFRLHYWQKKDVWDQCEIMKCFQGRASDGLWCFQFQEAAKLYRLIPKTQTPIVVPYGDRGRELIEALESSLQVNARLLRHLQRYTVGVRDDELAALAGEGAVIETGTGIWMLSNFGVYDRHLGLSTDAGYSPEALQI